MANCAIIDVGSNSVRLTAYHYSKDGYTCYLNEREILGLAAYIQNNRLNDVGIQKLIKVLKRYRTLIHDLAISQYTVLATAAIRNVENTEEIIAKVDAMTGITMQVLSGETEARLDFTGVLSEVPDRNGIIVDVGGGSSEIILFENREIVQAMSIPVGSLQVYTACVENFIPTPKERKLMKRLIAKQLDTFVWPGKVYPVLYGIGGTCRCTLRLAEELYADQQNTEEAQTVSFSVINGILKSIKKDLSGENHMQFLKAIYKAVPDRLFSVIPGLMILQDIASRIGAEELKICLGGIREGYLIEHLSEMLLKAEQE